MEFTVNVMKPGYKSLLPRFSDHQTHDNRTAAPVSLALHTGDLPEYFWKNLTIKVDPQRKATPVKKVG
jgi:hypothetical protein